MALTAYEPAGTTCLRTAPRDLKHQVKSAALIFSGRLVSLRTTTEEIPSFGPHKVITYAFLPDKIWRGASRDTIYLKALPQYDDMSMMALGKNYLFLLGGYLPYMTQCDPISKDFGSFSQELDRLFKKKRFQNLPSVK
ncbi:hypothetical protein [Hymenobacter elongatus]|uniref:Uncharacterized protein n=1 Tax=Hymenobacter elongatus TaxID=877208 RepID=A0A4Z0PP92_9BACT|nr:hypothetical protein [Hymenobacter elongatus]TGE18295.1 hypothetical protein E5J99_05155 [Hymenobacter elongatus]